MSETESYQLRDLRIRELDDETAELVLKLLRERLKSKQMTTRAEILADPVDPGGGDGDPKCTPKCYTAKCGGKSHGHVGTHGWLGV